MLASCAKRRVMGMKYILWGAGRRGRRALEIIGEEKVAAFIDRNPDKIGKMFLDKEILSLEKAMQLYPDCMYVITPEAGEEEMESLLEQRGIEARLRFDECPMGITYAYEKTPLFDLYPVEPKGKNCGLYGITLFSILLYDYWKNNYHVDVTLVPEKELSPGMRMILEKEYRIKSLDEASLTVDCWIAVKDGENLRNKVNSPFFDISELMEASAAFYNPQISALKGRHKGKRCFIVATGPSLLASDLDTLWKNKELCISMNKIYNIFHATCWRPDYYMIQDHDMIEDIEDEVAALDLKYKFVPSTSESYWKQSNAEGTIKYYSVTEESNIKIPGFSVHPEHYLYDGKTITYACLQLAAYIGFKEIYLLGVDFNYSSDINDPENHFAGYHTPDRRLRLYPVAKEYVAAAYRRAKEYADTHGIKIYNATRGGKLEIFERVDFDELFRQKV